MNRNQYTYGDYFIATEIIIIGLAEASHLCGVFLGWPLSRCILLFGGLLLTGALSGTVFFLRKRFWPGKNSSGLSPASSRFANLKSRNKNTALWHFFFIFMALGQLIFICVGNTTYLERDMTVEIVNSFLEEDGIYLVNPMTGFPYEGGIPLRLKILCLPTLYAGISKITGLEPVTVVWLAVPVITLLSGYVAFWGLGKCLFPKDERKRACFLAVVALLLWAGAYGYGMDGFGLLYCGWRGESIRSGILLPWLLSLCLRKKWLGAALCVLAEACIVWTLYGLGACAAVLLGMGAAGLVAERISKRRLAA